MALTDPSAPIPADLGKPLHTFQCEGPGSSLGFLLARLTFRKHPFGLWTVTVCEQGLASRDTRVVPNPRVLQNLDARWDEFVAAKSSLSRTYKGVFSSDFNIYVYELAGGGSFECHSGMQDVDRLAGLIQDEIYQRQFPRQSAAFNAGQAVNFGRVTIDKQGLKWDADLIPWDSLARISLHNGQFVVQRAGQPGLEMPLYEVKNFDILWTLLKSVLDPSRMA